MTDYQRDLERVAQQLANALAHSHDAVLGLPAATEALDAAAELGITPKP